MKLKFGCNSHKTEAQIKPCDISNEVTFRDMT